MSATVSPIKLNLIQCNEYELERAKKLNSRLSLIVTLSRNLVCLFLQVTDYQEMFQTHCPRSKRMLDSTYSVYLFFVYFVWESTNIL